MKASSAITPEGTEGQFMVHVQPSPLPRVKKRGTPVPFALQTNHPRFGSTSDKPGQFFEAKNGGLR
jgi:hypothetical protein